LLDDLAIAAYRAVQPLEVAVDDEDQVVQVLASGQRNRTEGFRLVHLSVAQETPDSLPGGVLQSPVLQVAEEAGLIDGQEGALPHGDSWKLPEVRHEPGMWIGREPLLGLHLQAEVVQMVLVQPSFEEGAGVDAGRSMALEIDEIPTAGIVVAV